MYERYLGKDGFFHTSDRLVGTAGQDAGERAESLSFVEIIAGLSDMREAADASTRVLTEQLAAEAFQVQQRAVTAEGGRPDFSSVLENPLRDAESSDHRLVTSPRLRLARADAASEV
jgi:hypothetical protein